LVTDLVFAGSDNAFADEHVLSMAQYGRDDLELLFRVADELSVRRLGHGLLAGKLMVSAFFDQSTRTRLAHEAAMLRLGGAVTGFADPSVTRAAGGTRESHEDIARMITMYGDVVVVRHPVTGWPARAAATGEGALVINGGDGVGEHPTQTMVDLYTLRQRFGRIDGLRLLLVNDLRMRCVRSLLSALRHYDCEIYAIPADGKENPEFPEVHICDDLRSVVSKVDVVYSSPTVGPQLDGPDSVAGVSLDRTLLEQHGHQDLAVLHPLPRKHEVTADVDDTPFNAYWAQARNGVPVRMALLALMFGAR
jgi:aspartate carbamoyltransferase catalytic subunit